MQSFEIEDEIEIKEEPRWAQDKAQCTSAWTPNTNGKEIRIALKNVLCSKPSNTKNNEPDLDQFQTVYVKNYSFNNIQETAASDPSIFYQKSSLNFEIQIYHQNILWKCDQEEVHELKKQYIEQLHKVCNLEVFKCKACQYETIHKHNIKLHLFLVHNTTLEYQIWRCRNCDYISTDPKSLKEHVEVHQLPKKETPLVCVDTKMYIEEAEKMNYYSDTETNLEMDNSNPSEISKTVVRRKRRKPKTKENRTSKVQTFKNYQCELCTYSTDKAAYFENHFEVHKHNAEIKPGDLWQCHECEYHTTKINQLTYHISRAHREQGKNIVCETCGQSFTREVFKRHILTHKTLQELELFECYNCGYKTKVKGDLRTHITNQHVQRPKYVCKICGLKSTRRSHHLNHVKLHEKSENPLYKCQVCAYKTNVKRYFQVHMKNQSHFSKVKGIEKTENTPVSFKEVTNSKGVVRRLVAPNPFGYECSKCDYKGFKWQGIDYHFRNTHPDIPRDILKTELIKKCLTCDFQSSGTKSSLVLRKHIKESHPECFTFTCDLCDFKCARVLNLRRHKKETHEKAAKNNVSEIEVIYQCDKCDYETKVKSILTKHKRTHFQRKKPNYQCYHCDFSTESKKLLKIHMPTHDSSHKCPYCPFKTYYSYNYMQHIDLHKNSKQRDLLKCKEIKQPKHINKSKTLSKPNSNCQYQCNICNIFKGVSYYDFKQHLLRLHEPLLTSRNYVDYATVFDLNETENGSDHKNHSDLDDEEKNSEPLTHQLPRENLYLKKVVVEKVFNI